MVAENYDTLLLKNNMQLNGWLSANENGDISWKRPAIDQLMNFNLNVVDTVFMNRGQSNLPRKEDCVLYMRNGDEIEGKIKCMVDDRLSFDSSFVNGLKVARKAISCINFSLMETLQDDFFQKDKDCLVLNYSNKEEGTIRSITNSAVNIHDGKGLKSIPINEIKLLRFAEMPAVNKITDNVKLCFQSGDVMSCKYSKINDFSFVGTSEVYGEQEIPLKHLDSLLFGS